MLQKFAPVAFLSSIVHYLLNEWSPIGRIRILQSRGHPSWGNPRRVQKDPADPVWHPIPGTSRYTLKIPTNRRKKH